MIKQINFYKGGKLKAIQDVKGEKLADMKSLIDYKVSQGFKATIVDSHGAEMPYGGNEGE